MSSVIVVSALFSIKFFFKQIVKKQTTTDNLVLHLEEVGFHFTLSLSAIAFARSDGRHKLSET